MGLLIGWPLLTPYQGGPCGEEPPMYNLEWGDITRTQGVKEEGDN